MSAEIEFQRALFSVLGALGLTVYDAAPQARDGASLGNYPYVEIGTLIAGEWDDNTADGFSILARVHTRSRSASMLEARIIQGQIYTALHHAALSVTGQNCILVMRESSDLMRQEDGSFHGVCEYRALLSKP